MSASNKKSNSTPRNLEENNGGLVEQEDSLLPKILQAESRQMVGDRQATGLLPNGHLTHQDLTNASLNLDPSYIRHQQNRLDYQKTYSQAKQ